MIKTHRPALTTTRLTMDMLQHQRELPALMDGNVTIPMDLNLSSCLRRMEPDASPEWLGHSFHLGDSIARPAKAAVTTAAWSPLKLMSATPRVSATTTTTTTTIAASPGRRHHYIWMDRAYSRPRSSCTHSTGLKSWQGQKPRRWTSHRDPWRHMWERQDAAWRRRPGRKFKDGPGIASPAKGQSGGKNTSSRPPMSKDLDDELGADPGTKTSLLPALRRRIPCRPRYFCNHRFLRPNVPYFVFLPKPCP